MTQSTNQFLFICSFCEQAIKIKEEHVGRRVPCPKCTKPVWLFPNRHESIDQELTSIWYLQSITPNHVYQEVGPFPDDAFLALVQSQQVHQGSVVRCPLFTQNQWVTANRVNLVAVHELVQQRYAERGRVERKQQQEADVALRKRQALLRAVSEAVSDGTVTVRERLQLIELSRSIDVPEQEVELLLKDEAQKLVQSVVDNALEDGFLEPHEKQRISELVIGLGGYFELSQDQLKKMELCEFACKLAQGEFKPDAGVGESFAITATETPLAEAKVEWLEVVQQKKPVGIPLGSDHYLKPIASGDCLVTSKRIVLMGQFVAKKITLASIESVRLYQDGVFCHRSSGKSVFLRPARNGAKWHRFAMLIQYVVTNRPVQGIVPDEYFCGNPVAVDASNQDVVLAEVANYSSNSTQPRYTFRVVGDHIGDRAWWVSQVCLNEPLYLWREPHNPHDANAVMVFDSSKNHLGYLKREVAEWFAPMMDHGASFRCEAYRKQESGGLIVAVYDL